MISLPSSNTKAEVLSFPWSKCIGVLGTVMPTMAPSSFCIRPKPATLFQPLRDCRQKDLPSRNVILRQTIQKREAKKCDCRKQYFIWLMYLSLLKIIVSPKRERWDPQCNKIKHDVCRRPGFIYHSFQPHLPNFPGCPSQELVLSLLVKEGSGVVGWIAFYYFTKSLIRLFESLFK